MSRILRLHRRASKAASEQTAARHIVARQREYQQLKALARLAGVPIAMLAPSGHARGLGGETAPTEVTEQLEAYIQRCIAEALDRRRGTS